MGFLTKIIYVIIISRVVIRNVMFCFRIKVLPAMVFDNLNSLETLSLQNNKLSHIPDDITENILDSLKAIDITGMYI